MSRATLFVPLSVFALVLGFGYLGFTLNDPHELPSALLGKPFPDFQAVRLDNGRMVDRGTLVGKPVLVNVWATWCPTCKAEHAELNRISREERLPIVGINYKDDAVAARRWLARYGDPYIYNLVDPDGRLGVELGVYGAPESFLVDGSGTIVYKRVGEVTRSIFETEIAPALERLEVR